MAGRARLSTYTGSVTSPTRRHVLIVTGEPLGTKMAGPAIRALEMATLLKPDNDVILATMGRCDLVIEGITTVHLNHQNARQLVEGSDVIIFQGVFLSIYHWAANSDAVIIPDIYDPFHLETLEQESDRPMAERWEVSHMTVEALNHQIRRGDYFVCASEKQRDFWLGQLAGQGRINPTSYDEDASLRRLIDVAPFGLPEEPPVQKQHGLRGVIDGIGQDDKVILWGGGVYNWFDPLTLIRAMAVVAEKVPEARLVFMGMKHPNPDVPAMAMANHSRELAEQLGLTGRHVFFNETWVPYQDRADLLLDADIGVSCHFDHIETEFSFRTRILDYLWAGLPIVCTQGDAFATLVETEGLGATAAPEDVLGLDTALIDLLTDEPARAAASERVKEVATRFTWRQSLAPLMAFMADPRRAPDLHPDTPRPHTPAGFVHRPKFGPRADLALFRTYLDQGGPGELVRRMTGRVRRIARETVSGR